MMAFARSQKNDTSKLRTHNIQDINAGLLFISYFVVGLVLIGGHYDSLKKSPVTLSLLL